MADVFDFYRKKVTKLRTYSSGKYLTTKNNRAPHKPILLLTIFDLFDQGQLLENLVPLSAELVELFHSYWELVMPSDYTARWYYPFFHLKSDGFWNLLPIQGKEHKLRDTQEILSANQLREVVIGGQFELELYQLVVDLQTREALRRIIIETYFDESIHELLWLQHYINIEGYRYGQQLLNAVHSPNLSKVEVDDVKPPIRDAGFRQAIVKAYNHRCVMCGIRLVTDEGRTVAEAAHIIPWSVSHNDDPRNGLCLCRLCHWVFDIGLATITNQYVIRLSSQLNSTDNISGHLATLHQRPIFEPIESVFNPDVESLLWHLQNVFLK